MALSFPTSPAVDQVYTFGDYAYTWDGTKWTSRNQSVALEPLVQPRDIGDGVRTTFAAPSGYGQSAASYLVVVNGAVQHPELSYIKVSGGVEFFSAPPTGASVDIVYYQPVINESSKAYSVVASDTAAVSGGRYLADCTLSHVTITLPVATPGDYLIVGDYNATVGNYNITVTSTQNIHGTNNDLVIASQNTVVELSYIDNVVGWKAVSAIGELA